MKMLSPNLSKSVTGWALFAFLYASLPMVAVAANASSQISQDNTLTAAGAMKSSFGFPANKTAEDLLPAGKERALAEIQLRKSMSDRLGRSNVIGWESSRLRQDVKTLPVTGDTVPSISAFETEWKAFMRLWLIPGSTIAIAKQGKLVYARGFGY